MINSLYIDTLLSPDNPAVQGYLFSLFYLCFPDCKRLKREANKTKTKKKKKKEKKKQTNKKTKKKQTNKQTNKDKQTKNWTRS